MPVGHILKWLPAELVRILHVRGRPHGIRIEHWGFDLILPVSALHADWLESVVLQKLQLDVRGDLAQVWVHLLLAGLILLKLVMVVQLCNLSLVHFLILKQIEFIITQYLLSACILSIYVRFDLIVLTAGSVELGLGDRNEELVILREQMLGILLRGQVRGLFCLDV